MLAYSATSGSTTSTLVPLTDVLGSTLGLVNSSGSLATQYTYEPFGVPTISDQVSNYPYLFAGMEFDAATGLYHTPARYYSPRLQRFLSEDPLQFGGGDANLFGYAGNDPAGMKDPTGKFAIAAAAVAGLIGGTVGVLAAEVASGGSLTAAQVAAAFGAGAVSAAAATALTAAAIVGMVGEATGAVAIAGEVTISSVAAGTVEVEVVNEKISGGSLQPGHIAVAAASGMVAQGLGIEFAKMATPAAADLATDLVAGEAHTVGTVGIALSQQTVHSASQKGQEPLSFGQGFQPALQVPSNLNLGLVSPGPLGSTLGSEIDGIY